MEIRLVERLQKIKEEDLFPNVTPGEENRRAEEVRLKREAHYNSFNIGDKVYPTGGWGPQPMYGIVIDKRTAQESTGTYYSIKIRRTGGKSWSQKELWWSTNGAHKVSESKVNEEDLFPNASEEDIEVRKEEQAENFLKRLKGLKIGDEVEVRNLRMPSPACNGKVEWISLLDRDNPIKVRFDDGFAGFYSIDRVTKLELSRGKSS